MIHDLTRKTLYMNRNEALSLIGNLSAAIAPAERNIYQSFTEAASEWERGKPDAPGFVKFTVVNDYDTISRVKG